MGKGSARGEGPRRSVKGREREADRQARRAAALRENLRKRKAQTRHRSERDTSGGDG